MKADLKIRLGLRIILDMGASELEENFAGVHRKQIARHLKMSEKQTEPIISALESNGLIMTVGFEKSVYILSRPLEYISINDINGAFEKEYHND